MSAKTMKTDPHYEQTREAFDLVAIERDGYYDSQQGQPLKHSFWHLRVRAIVHQVLTSLLDKHRNIHSVLDAGCGRGDFTIELKDRYPRLSHLCGVDFSGEALQLARNEVVGQDGIRFEEGTLLDLPVAEDFFDLTLCINTLHHVRSEDQPRALAELAHSTREFLLLEIKNMANPYYKYVHPRKTYFGVDVYPTSVQAVSESLDKHGFQLCQQKGIFVFSKLSPNVVLLFEKRKSAT